MNYKTIKELLSASEPFQQNCYELSCDWNVYKPGQEYEYLKENICYALYGVSLSEVSAVEHVQSACFITGDDYGRKKARDEVKKKILMNEKKRSERIKTIELLHKKIVDCGSRNEVDGELYFNTIYNVILGVKGKEREAFPIPIFKVRRCLDVAAHNATAKKKSLSPKFGEISLYSYCVSYIDTEGRVYENWTDYITNNTLPKCTMVVPVGGRYQPHPFRTFDESHSIVWLEIGPSPAWSPDAKLISDLDTVSSAVSFAATIIGVAALLTPVGAAVGAAATFGGAASGLYIAARSTLKLADRRAHKQSINVTDENARSDWLGVAGGFTGFAYSRTAADLGKAAQAGATIGTASKAVYNTLMVGNLLINGIGIGNGAFNIWKTYKETGEYSSLEIAQLAAHLLFFSNTVLNVQTAGKVISNTQGAVLKEYEDSLRSTRHRNAFRFMKRAVQAANDNPMAGNAEVIRGIRRIENRDDFTAIIREFWKAPVRASIRIASGSLSQSTTQSATQSSNASSARQMHGGDVKGNISTFSLWVKSSTQLEESFEKIIGNVVMVGCMKTIKIVMEEVQKCDDGENTCDKLLGICLRMIEESKDFLTSKFSLLLEFVWKFVKEYASQRTTNFPCRESMSFFLKLSEYSRPDVSIERIAEYLIDRIFTNLNVWRQFIVDGFKEESRKKHSCKVCSGCYFE